MSTPDFSFCSWTAPDISREATAAIAAKEAALLAVKHVPEGKRTFANTIVTLERAGEPYADLSQTLQLLMGTHPDTAIRDAAQAASSMLDEANVRMEHDRALYSAVISWEATGERLDLKGADAKLADDMVRDFKRMGFGLPQDQFEEFQRNQVALQLEQDAFEKAINDWDDGIEVDVKQLEGLPESYRARLSKTPTGKYRVSLRYPDLHPFMRLSHDDGARRELAAKNLRKGGDENMARLARMIRLRQRNAVLLGYATHADYVTQTRMAKNASAAVRFIQDLMEKLIPAARRELRDLIKLKKAVQNLEHPKPIGFHEFAYWAERLCREKYDLDAELLRPYFPLTRVLDGMMRIYEDLFGVSFVPLEQHVWHPDTSVYVMRDRASDQSLGTFVLDLFPRSGKYGHAAVFPIRLQKADPMAALVCNFPKPTEQEPSLLSHGEVEVLFHEFGHLVHALVSSRVPYAAQNGMSVVMDFIEAPSQLLEEWVWSPEVLAKISSHHEAREPLPAALIQKLLDARHHMDANAYLAQAVMALYDLRMHGQSGDTEIEPAHLAQWHRDMELEYRAMDLPDDAIKAAGWDHMADYDAGYYGYLWSKVYALDMFTRFEKNPLDGSVGAAYRREVLEKGGTCPAETLVREFLGRESSHDAFFAALGIHPS